MDVEYKGQHSIIFFKDTGKGYSKRNSWIDFHMIPATRPYVALGSPNIAQVAIPGTSKRVDITDYRPGGLTFGGRTGTWEFYIDHTKWEAWADAKNTIRDYIHGGTFLVNLTDDAYILYQGILTVSGYVAGQNYSKITIQYDLMAETMTLDEPIDFGMFGKLPDPKLVDSDGDGFLDGLDLDGDGIKDVDLTKNIGYDTDCDGKSDTFVPFDSEARPKRKLVYGAGSSKVEGLDIDGDGKSDFYAFEDPSGRYGFDFDCNGFVEEELDGTDYVDPHDIDIPDDFLPSNTKPKDEWKWIVGDDGEITGLDVTGDDKPDFILKEGDDGWTLVPAIQLPDDPGSIDPRDLDIPQGSLPEDALPQDEWTWKEGGPGENPCLDVSGDGVCDFVVGYDGDGNPILIPVNEPSAIDEPLPEPPNLPDADEYDIPEEVASGYDIDCDGVVDIPVDQINPIPPKLLYDEDGKLIGVDYDADGNVDNYAYDDDGNWGIDYDCDGIQDQVQPINDPTSVIGAYYPLIFIQSDGTESSMYGLATVTKSNKILGVYDLYTIYESDEVAPDSFNIE